jgi:REP element-mobilizing transposase RayT
MNYNPEAHHRRSIRLKGYDYSQNEAYFVTICACNRECLFGEVANGVIELSPIGESTYKFWFEIPWHFENVQLDEFVVMPNHFHGIIVITDNCRGGVTPPLQKCTLGKIVAYFKYQTTKFINQIRNIPGLPLWQRNYYEHIIRNEDELNRIRQYIIENPLKWEEDIENPLNWKKEKVKDYYDQIF